MNITQKSLGYNVTLGVRVKALRRALTPPVRLEVIAAALDVHVATVYNIEAGHGCRSETLPRLAVFFGVSLDYLFGLTETPALQTLPPVVTPAVSHDTAGVTSKARRVRAR